MRYQSSLEGNFILGDCFFISPFWGFALCSEASDIVIFFTLGYYIVSEYISVSLKVSLGICRGPFLRQILLNQVYLVKYVNYVVITVLSFSRNIDTRLIGISF